MNNKPSIFYKAAFFTVTAQTSLHVGAGGENFWIIDNLVQRDPATNLPCIYSSSLKGALREYMRDYLQAKDPESWLLTLTKIFGNDRSDFDGTDEEYSSQLETEKKDLKKLNFPGQFRFLQAELLSLPIHKEGYITYQASCSWLKENLIDKLRLFSHNLHDRKPEDIINADGFLSDTDFCKIADDYHLPVIARNQLENGESKNLWYEQVLPRGTKFFFTVLYEDESLFTVFSEALQLHPVQIGANASIGYGFCKIEKILSTQILQS